MECYRIEGRRPLRGQVTVDGAKNAALPIMAASLLTNEPVRLRRVPRLADVATLARVLARLGVESGPLGADAFELCTRDPRPTLADRRLVRRMRASFCVLGPLLARRGRAVVALPGGCRLGPRPVDLHLAGLAALGAELRVDQGYVIGTARRLRGATVHLRGARGPTVTGTANVLSAATLARGKTTIVGAATEPEIVDLGHFLIALGARISGLGSDSIEIQGVDQLGGADHRLIPDRIESATWLIAAAMTQGDVCVSGVQPEHLQAVVAALGECGATIDVGPDSIRLLGPHRVRPGDWRFLPFPGLPTDVQAPLMALVAGADGTSTLDDRVFPERFRHVGSLARLGARIRHSGSTARVRGVARLHGAVVAASDLRAGACLVLAGLAAEGQTVVRGLEHLDRGYADLSGKLRRLGASIERLPVCGSAPLACKVMGATVQPASPL